MQSQFFENDVPTDDRFPLPAEVFCGRTKNHTRNLKLNQASRDCSLEGPKLTLNSKRATNTIGGIEDKGSSSGMT